MAVIGIDFDNTIACYDQLIFDEALKRGLIAPETTASKTVIRDAIRERDDGEMEWRLLQPVIYGRCISRATVFAGVTDFLQRRHAARDDIHIVSHKTRISRYDPDKLDLRRAAREWIKGMKLEQYLVSGDRAAFFESTSGSKVKRVASLGCEIFIDDLPETLTHQDFPPNVNKILFDPHNQHKTTADIYRCQSWQQIKETVATTLGR